MQEPNFLLSALETGGLLFVLCFFVWYFIKQLEIRDAKITKLQSELMEQEVKIITALLSNTKAFEELIICLKQIEKKVEHITKNTPEE